MSVSKNDIHKAVKRIARRLSKMGWYVSDEEDTSIHGKTVYTELTKAVAPELKKFAAINKKEAQND